MIFWVRQSADPNLEELHAARHVDGRHDAFAALGEFLDVRVVAVVQAALLANDVEEMARLVAMLAEPRIRDPKGIEIPLAAPHVEREAEADRHVGPRLVDEHDGAALERRKLDRGGCGVPSRGQLRHRGLQPLDEGIVEAAPEPQHCVCARVVALVERAHVVERDRA
jgi:hypothetical protein